MAVTNDEAAEKAWDEWVDTHPDILDDEHAVFVDGFAAGRASRDAENEKLRTAENLLAMNALQMSQSTPMSLNQAAAFLDSIFRQATDHRRLAAEASERASMLAILSIASWEVGLDGHLGNLLAPYRQLREGTETRTSKEKAVPGA